MNPSTPLCSAGCLAFPGLLIANLATDGILPRADRGLFDLSGLRAGLPAAQAGEGEGQRRHGAKPGGGAIAADEDQGRQLPKLEARKLAGELVPAADIEAAWLAVAGTVRTRLLLIPTKTAPRIVALKTPAEAQALLRKEINAALAAIATTPAI